MTNPIENLRVRYEKQLQQLKEKHRAELVDLKQRYMQDKLKLEKEGHEELSWFDRKSHNFWKGMAEKAARKQWELENPKEAARQKLLTEAQKILLAKDPAKVEKPAKALREGLADLYMNNRDDKEIKDLLDKINKLLDNLEIKWEER